MEDIRIVTDAHTGCEFAIRDSRLHLVHHDEETGSIVIAPCNESLAHAVAVNALLAAAAEKEEEQPKPGEVDVTVHAFGLGQLDAVDSAYLAHEITVAVSGMIDKFLAEDKPADPA